MMGRFAGEFFADWPGADYRKQFTRDYFFQSNQYWLREYHVDGFRYDYVPGMYDGPIGQGYAELVYRTYQDSKTLSRFRRPAGAARSSSARNICPMPSVFFRRLTQTAHGKTAF